MKTNREKQAWFMSVIFRKPNVVTTLVNMAKQIEGYDFSKLGPTLFDWLTFQVFTWDKTELHPSQENGKNSLNY